MPATFCMSPRGVDSPRGPKLDSSFGPLHLEAQIPIRTHLQSGTAGNPRFQLIYHLTCGLAAGRACAVLEAVCWNTQCRFFGTFRCRKVGFRSQSDFCFRSAQNGSISSAAGVRCVPRGADIFSRRSGRAICFSSFLRSKRSLSKPTTSLNCAGKTPEKHTHCSTKGS